MWKRIAAVMSALVVGIMATFVTAAPAEAAGGRYYNEAIVGYNGQHGFDMDTFIQKMDNEIKTGSRGYLATKYTYDISALDALGNPIPLASMRGPGKGLDCHSFIGYSLKDFANIDLMSNVPCKENNDRPGQSFGYGWNDFPRTGDWAAWALHCNIKHDVYNDVTSMLKSGTLNKGDIVVTSGNGKSSDSLESLYQKGRGHMHLLYFWGDTPSQNKFLHCSPSGNGRVQLSTCKGKPNITKLIVIHGSSPKGNVSIKKSVSGTTAVEKNYTYKLTMTLPAGSFAWKNTNGASGNISNGGTLNIKNGETITIENLPAGASYKVVENAPPGFKVTATNASGKVVAKTTTKATIKNSYTASGSWSPTAKKILTGRKITAGEFKFRLESGSKVLQTKACDASGKVEFSPIKYTAKDHGKTYTYKIHEVLPSDDDPTKPGIQKNGVTYDSHVATVKVVVKDNGKGVMTTTRTITSTGGLTWGASGSQTYEAKGSWAPEAQKKAVGFNLTEGMFTFELRQNNATGTVLQTKACDANGKVTFDPISYTEEDCDKKFTYAIVERRSVSEESGLDAETVEFDTSVRLVSVTPKDNKNGTIKCSPVYSNGKTFTNSLKPGSLSIKKVVEGTPSTNPSFSVVVSLKDAAGKTVSGDFPYSVDTSEGYAGTVHDGGAVTLHRDETVTIHNLPANTVFTITEPNLPKGYALKQIDNPTGTIVTNETSSATVTNEYSLSGSVTLRAGKQLVDGTLRSGQFTFILWKDDPEHPYDTQTNDSSGVVTFKEIPLTQEDVGTTQYWYAKEIVENPEEGMSYDNRIVCYEVKPMDNGDGTIVAQTQFVDPETHEADPTPPIFTNTVKPGLIAIRKDIDSDDEADNNQIFHYTLTLFDETGQPVDIELDDEMLSISDFEQQYGTSVPVVVPTDPNSGSGTPSEPNVVAPESTSSSAAPIDSPALEEAIGQDSTSVTEGQQPMSDGHEAHAGEEAPAEPSDEQDSVRPYRLIVPTDSVDDAEVAGMEMGRVESAGGMSLVGFSSEEAMDDAIAAYEESGVVASEDMGFSTTDPDATDSATEEIRTDEVPVGAIDMTADDNPFKVVEETSLKVMGNGKKPTILAVLDTGVPDGCVGYSVLGDDPKDVNGHATMMYEDIKPMIEDSNVQVVFIKVLGDGGYGTASSVLAGLDMASQLGANVINMSLSAYAPKGIPAVEDAIDSFVKQGGVVVGAAGNGGIDVAHTVPGRVSSAIIMTACDEDGNILENANHGGTVDALALATSTSHASAMAAGWIASNDGDQYSVAGLFGELFLPNTMGQNAGAANDNTAESDGDYTFKAADTGWKMPYLQLQTHYSKLGLYGTWQTTTETTPTYTKGTNSATVRNYYDSATKAYQRIQNFKLQYARGNGPTGGVQYTAHIETVGWMTGATTYSSTQSSPSKWYWFTNGAQCPKEDGKSRDLEAVYIKLTGNAAKFFDISYKVHTSSTTESGKTTKPGRPNENLTGKNGTIAGTTGESTAIDKLYVWLVPKETTLKLNPNGGKFKSAYTVSGNTLKANSTATYTMATNLRYGSTAHSLIGPVVIRDGYTFAGWYDGTKQVWDKNRKAVALANYWSNTQANSGVWLGGGTAAAPVSSITAVAHWTANKYTITVKPNGGTWNNKTTDTAVNVTYDATTGSDLSTQSSATNAVRAGYRFAGLYTEASGGTQVYDANGKAKKVSGYWSNTQASGGVWKGTSNVTLYARWTPINYALTFAKDDGVESYDIYRGSTKLTTLTGDPYTVSDAHVSDAFSMRNIKYVSGYAFDSVANSANLGTLNTSNVAQPAYTMGVGVTTLTLKSHEKSYNIAYSPNGGIGDAFQESVSMVGKHPLATSSFFRDGYTFKGWNTKADGTGKAYAPGDQVAALTSTDGSTVTLYAQWTKLSDRIKKKGNGVYDIQVQANHVTVIPNVPAGTHYLVTEKVPMGWTLVSREDYEGLVESLKVSTAKFQNKKTPGDASTSAKFELTAQKVIDNGSYEVKAGDATFQVFEVNSDGSQGAMIAEQPCDEHGVAHFAHESFCSPDNIELESEYSETRHYLIKEKEPENESQLKQDTHVEEATVQFTKKANEDFIDVDVTYSPGQLGMARFNNTHEDGKLEVKKSVPAGSPNKVFTFTIALTKNGKSLPDGTYGTGDEKFEIKDGVTTVMIRGGETKVLGGIPTGARYVVTEEEEPGWTLTSCEGETGAINSGETSKAKFDNAYDATGSLVLSGRKILRGSELANGMFEFGLYDESDTQIDTASCDANGSVTFNRISYSYKDVGTHKYTIKEINKNNNGIKYATTEETVVVTVSDNGDGTLSATYPLKDLPTEEEEQDEDGEPEDEAGDDSEGDAEPEGDTEGATSDDKTGFYFVNETKTTELRIEKQVQSEGAPDVEFTFDIELTVPETATNKGPFKYTGSTTGLISEKGQVTLRAGEYIVISGLPIGTTWKVAESDLPEGWEALTSQEMDGTTEVDEVSTATFVNDYSASGQWVPTVTKMMEGRSLQEGEFEFQIATEDGDVIQTATNLADGSIPFEPIEYTLEDIETLKNSGKETITYVVSEVTGTDQDVAYDTHSITYDCTLTDDEAGNIVVEATNRNGDQTSFINTVKEGMLQVEKVTTGTFESAPSSERSFFFRVNLMDSEGAPLAGKYPVSVEALTPEAIQEVADSIGDGTDVDVPSDASDNGDGTADTGGTEDGSETGGEAGTDDGEDGGENQGENQGEDDENATYIENGTGIITLKSGERAIVTGLPVGTTYTVEEISEESATTGTTEAGVEYEGSSVPMLDGFNLVTQNSNVGMIMEKASDDEDQQDPQEEQGDEEVEDTPGEESGLDAGASDDETPEREPSEPAVFLNAYSAVGEWRAEARKKVTGGELKAEEFQFDLLDESGNVIATTWNDEYDSEEDLLATEDESSSEGSQPRDATAVEHPAEGLVVFPTQYVDEPGQYRYKIVEHKNETNPIIDFIMRFSRKEYGVVVNVTDAGDGSLNCEVTYEGLDAGDTYPTFVNEYLDKVAIGTKLGTVDGRKDLMKSDKKVKLIDTVSYSNLIVGKTYELKGELRLKDGTAEGKKLSEGTATFKPSETSGTTTVEMELDLSDLSGDVVAFEELYVDGNLLAEHKDLSDGDQTVHVHEGDIRTRLATIDGEKDYILTGTGTFQFTDTVSYENLIPNEEYTLQASLHSADDGKDNGVIEGTETSKKFTPSAASGTVDITLTVDASKIKKGSGTVAFEKLYWDSELVASHEDINDKDQTVTPHVPSIGTKLATIDGATAIDRTDSTVTLVDTVEYKDLIPGKKYVLRGTIHIRKDGKDAGAIDGAVATQPITPDSPSGTAQVTFQVNLSLMNGDAMVAFEELYQVGDGGSEGETGDQGGETDTLIAEHKDISDGNQTIEMNPPFIGTKFATHSGEKEAMITITPNVTELVDTVEYRGLIPGASYIMRGTAHIKRGGTDAGEVTGSQTDVPFTPKSADGTLEVPMKIDMTQLQDGDQTVAFEELYVVSTTGDDQAEGSDGPTLVKDHKDINDENQTVTFHSPSVRTTLMTSDGKKETSVQGTETITLVDTVEYHNLVPGMEYELRGEIHTKLGDGRDGGAIAGSSAVSKFTPKSADGKETVSMKLRVQDANQSLVAFEELYLATGGNDEEGNAASLVAEHKDINDENQTVSVRKSDTSGLRSDLVQMGGNAIVGAWVVSTVGAVALFVARHRKAKMDDLA